MIDVCRFTVWYLQKNIIYVHDDIKKVQRIEQLQLIRLEHDPELYR